ncbi:fimbrial protein [Pseudomonas sp. PDM13]|uniref:fimbrial protein n=1 Tax=Pseudomonas sp. PDM13 TaxID=2769255 RepID=UPI0021E06915|nr:fimbrial protein [Pseudomonas sp. PDM13]MCU9948899.1 fimbrial protein [Pseudomonas sp. PDM13]
MKDSSLLLALLLAGTLAQKPLPAVAEENMKFRGTLVEAPSCVVNQGGMIDVDFGEQLGVKDIDGVHYRKLIDYQLECQASARDRSVVLSIHGASSDFDRAAVQTSLPDLGIRLLHDGQPLALDSELPIDPAHPPALEAVPVQRPGAELAEGAFDATATLQADYQ